MSADENRTAYPCKHGGQVFCGSCETPEPGQPNAAVLKLAFWEAMKRVGDDGGVHFPYQDASVGLVDGVLVDELWEHMAVAIAELRAAAGLEKP